VTQSTDQETKDDRQSSRRVAQALGKLVALVLVVVLVILIERYCQVQVPSSRPGAKIVSLDGDTLKAANGVEYRIFGIDAPELHQTCNQANGKSWLCCRAAKARLTTLINRGNVNCEARANDRFGRIVAVCSAEGVPDLGEALVRDGYAIDLGGATGNPYREAQAEAEAAKRGIWRGKLRAPFRSTVGLKRRRGRRLKHADAVSALRSRLM
jgi:endonuclease YncB( thermonuclease family)